MPFIKHKPITKTLLELSDLLSVWNYVKSCGNSKLKLYITIFSSKDKGTTFLKKTTKHVKII
jgi:hypothetical protein